MNTQIVIKSLEKEALPVTKKISSLLINSQESYDSAGELLKELKAMDKRALEEENKIADPMKAALAATKAHFKPFHDSVKLIVEDTKNKMLVFVNDACTAQRKLLEDFDAGKIKKIATLTAKQEALHIVNSAAQVRMVWTLEIEDVAMVPREYLSPDEAKIREAFKAGKKIKGCTWKQVRQIAV